MKKNEENRKNLENEDEPRITKENKKSRIEEKKRKKGRNYKD